MIIDLFPTYVHIHQYQVCNLNKLRCREGKAGSGGLVDPWWGGGIGGGLMGPWGFGEIGRAGCPFGAGVGHGSKGSPVRVGVEGRKSAALERGLRRTSGLSQPQGCILNMCTFDGPHTHVHGTQSTIRHLTLSCGIIDGVPLMHTFAGAGSHAGKVI